MGDKAQPDISEISRTDFGEIDTSAPFQSVKAAISMFVEGALSAKPGLKKSKQQSSEGPQKALAKESQLHVAQKELNKLKEHMKNCETTRTQALTELDRAKRTVDSLTSKLKTIEESKQYAVSETARLQTKQLEQVSSNGQDKKIDSQALELENIREKYKVAAAELDVAKQELRKAKQEFEASTNAKANAVKQAADTKKLMNTNNERATNLSKKIAEIQEAISQLKSATVQTKEGESEVIDEKSSVRESHKLALEEAENKLKLLKEKYDSEASAELEAKLAETTTEIDNIQNKIKELQKSDWNLMEMVTKELDGAKELQQKVAEEDSSLRSSLESLKMELEIVKKEHLELQGKEAEADSEAARLNTELQRSKDNLEKAIVEESKAKAACDDMTSALNQLSMDAKVFRIDAETMKRSAEDLRKESEETRISLEEAEKKLEIALKNAEEAKAAEANALFQIKFLTEKANAARTSTSESGALITISAEELESLSRKVEESQTLSEMKVAAALAQVEAVEASENEVIKKLEAWRKEVEDLKLATEEALKRADMAEKAAKMLEGEMIKWREKDPSKAAEIISLQALMQRTDIEISKTRPSIPNTPTKSEQKQKLGKAPSVKTSLDKTPSVKKKLMPSLSAIFYRTKSHIGSASPSRLPDDKP